MNMRQGRWTWVNGKPVHQSQMHSNEPLWFTCMGILLLVLLALFG